MLTIETKELKISLELKRKVEMICKFTCAKPTFTNGNIKSIKETNIAYVMPHIIKVNNIDYFMLKINKSLKDLNSNIIVYHHYNYDIIYCKTITRCKYCKNRTIRVSKMNNKQYLNEEENQRISKKLGLISKIMIICGIIGFIVCSILLFGNLISFEARGLIGFAWVGCAACGGLGLVLFTMANQRKISAYMAQQQMPIAKEGIEKMAPSVGTAAKEIAKGVKEGLKDEDK